MRFEYTPKAKTLPKELFAKARRRAVRYFDWIENGKDGECPVRHRLDNSVCSDKIFCIEFGRRTSSPIKLEIKRLG